MSTEAISPLRQRMIEDMNARKLGTHSQRSHIYSCKRFAAFLKRSPDTATPDDVRRFQLHLAETGMSICNRNRIMTGVKFLLRVTLRRLDLAAEIYHLREPQKIPQVMSPDETRRLLAVAANAPSEYDPLMGAIVPFGRPGLAGKWLLLLLVPAAAGVVVVALAWFSLYGRQAGQVDQVPQIGRPAGVTVIMRGKVSKPLAPGQVDIIDGDTVRIDGQPYRLVGFDTPENGLTARCQRERDLAARATLRLRQIIAKGGL